MIRTFVLIAVTVYAGYTAQPLFCDRGDGLLYDETAAPWVSLPASEEGETWQCGDLIYLAGVDAEGERWSLMARALDAGPLAGYCVEIGQDAGGECVPIGADVPAHLAPFDGLSAWADTFVNFSEEARMR